MTARRMPFDDLARLAAAHAALDPGRQKWRRDILISSLIEILALKEPINERDLLRRIKKIWLTDAVDKAMLHGALELAKEAGLVEQRSNDGNWVARPGCIEDANADRAWAETVVERFERDLGKRLSELLTTHEVTEPTRPRRLTQYFIGALMAGSQRVLQGVMRSGDPESLRGIDFDLAAVDAYLRARVIPEKVATALRALAVAALDPADDFGKEIVRLIMAGQILQGMLAYRDLAGPSWIEGSTLVLDTSVLIYRLDSNGPQFHLLDELLRMSAEFHCNIVVTRAVVNEWNRIWRRGENDVQTWSNKSTDLPQALTRLARNPVLRNWQQRAEHGASVTWREFKHSFSHIESWLADQKIEIVEDEQADPVLVERMREELLKLSAAREKPIRTEATALTDAVSAAIVAKARNLNSSLVPTAWFIAEDWFTNEAYDSVFPDDKFPVASSMEVWLLLLSRSRIGDPAQAGDLAETVGDAVIQRSFLTVSAGFGVDELIEITDILSTAVDADAETLAREARIDYIELAKLSSNGKDVATELYRQRAHRRDQQVRRKERQVDEVAQDLEDRIQQIKELAGNLEKANKKLHEENEKLHEDNETLRAADVRIRHTAWLVTAIFIMASAVGGAAGLEAKHWVVVGGAVLTVAVGLEGYKWRSQPGNVKPTLFIVGIAATIAWVVLGGVIPLIL